VLSIAATVAGMTSGFIVTALVARTLGPEGSGIVALIVWLAMSAVAVAGLGRPQVILKFTPSMDASAAGRLTSVAFLQGVPLALLICGGLLLAQLWGEVVPLSQSGILISAGVVFFVGYFLFVYATAAAHGRGRFGETALTTALGSSLQLPFAVAGGILAGPAGAIAGMTLRYLPQALLITRYCRWITKRTELPSGASTYGWQIWLTDMIDLLALSRIELLVLGLFWQSSDVGYFAVAIAFFGIVGQISLQLSSVFIVGFSKQDVDITDGPATASYHLTLRLLGLFFVPIAFGGAALMPVFLPMVFGQDFVPAVAASMVLMASSAWTAIAAAPWGYLAARGDSRLLLKLMIVLAILSTAALLLLVPAFGVIGAATARGFAEALFLVLLVVAVRRRNGPAFPLGSLMLIGTAGVACGLVAFVCLILVPSVLGLSCAIFLGAAVYIFLLRMLPVLTSKERAQILRSLEDRLPKRHKVMGLRIVSVVLG